MKTIIVDDEPLAIERFHQLSKNIDAVSIIGEFDNPEKALEFARKNAFNLAVLDIEMPGIGGIELGKKISEIRPEAVLIYTTGYQQYALDAYKLHAAEYLMKPYSLAELEYAVQSAELLSRRKHHKVVIRTFGKFDVFVDGQPVFFKNAKAKELLALMVDAKGGSINSGYAISMLWEDHPFDQNSQSLYYKTAGALEKTLREWDIENIIIKNRYERCVNRKEFICDYYRMLEKDKEAIKFFSGEYMSQYSWAEETLAGIYKLLSV